jgi:protein-S-isoprenylcysteine O-methyltransferase Ste14
MTVGRYLSKHGIVRSAARQDVRTFLLPAGLVAVAGGAVTVWSLAGAGTVTLLSGHSITGMAMVFAGAPTAITAAITLRRFYSSTLVIRQDHQLITHGVYRFSRHPIYLATIVVFLGLTVFAASLPGFLVMLALIPLFLIRIRREERLLTEAFGDAYRQYQQRTAKLVPFVH